MIKKEIIWSEYLLIITIALITPIFIQSTIAFQIGGNTYDSAQTIITSGGTDNTSSSNYYQQIAIGQAATGLVISNSFDNYLGFFFASEGNEAPSWAQGIPTETVDEDTDWTTHDSNLSANGNGQCVDPNYGDVLSYSITTENTAQVDCRINNDVELDVKPAANWTGTASCTVRCSDGVYIADYSFNIEVTNVNDKPTQGTPKLNATDNPLNRTTANLTAYNQSTEDIDGDIIYNIVDFRKDGTSIAVLNMPFDTNITTTTTGAIRDYSTFANNGTLVNSPIWTSNGKVGGVYNFSNSNGYVNTTLTVNLSQNDFTVEAWVLIPNGVSTSYAIAQTHSTGGYSSDWILILGSSNNLFWMRTVTLGNYSSINDGNWHYLALVWDESAKTYKGYVDGANIGTSATVSNYGGINSVKIGTRGDATTTFFNGTIDQVRIYNRTLSENEIKQHNATNYNIIVSNETSKGESWIVAVTPSDLIVDGETLTSNAVVIENTPPIITSTTLTSTSGNNLTSDNLTVTSVSTDADFDAITNITDWRLDGTSIAVLNMPFDTNITTTAAGAIRDYSTFANNGTLGGGSWINSGQVGGAYNFTSNNYINLSNDLGYNEQVSAFAWFKQIGPPKGGYHIIFGGQELEISIPTAGTIRTGVYTNARFVSNDGSGLTDGNWHHIGFTFNGTTKNSYIDGQFAGTLPVTGTLISSFANRKIGQWGSSTDYYLNGSIDEVKIYNYSLSPEQIWQDYLEGNSSHHTNTIVSNETSKGDTWTVAVTPNDVDSDGNTLVSNQLTIVDSAPTITLTYPTNDTSLTQYTNRTPMFTWDGNDDDADTLNYTIWVYEDASLTSLNITNSTLNAYYLITNDLELDTPYWWIVEVYDGNTRVNSTIWNFTIESYKAISLTTNSINFGNVERNTSVDTENNATPLLIENIGNIYVNLSIYANTTLWVNKNINTSYFQYRADVDEAGAYNTTTSQITWKNMDSVSTNLLREFNFHASMDSAEIDINISAPEKEPPGSKQSQIVVTAD